MIQLTIKDRFITWYFNEFHADELFHDMLHTTEASPYHREVNVGVHTDMVVTQYMSRWEDLIYIPKAMLGAFACAFHDVGKPEARRRKYSTKRSHYNSFAGHEKLSARLWEDWAMRNWSLLTTQFGFTERDLYSVAWLIEYHMPWEIKNKDMLKHMRTTAGQIDMDVYAAVLRSDTWGRISDDHPEKKQKVSDWIDTFEQMEIAKKIPGKGPKIVMPIAPPGAGKSTLASAYGHCEYFSWDALRVLWYDDDYTKAYRASTKDPQFNSKAMKVFNAHLKEGNDIFVDNTNLSTKRRRGLLTEARRKGYYKIAVLLPIDLDTLLERRVTREDKSIPIDSVIKQYKSLSVPSYGEFDEIIVVMSNVK
jgi:predicted kinase